MVTHAFWYVQSLCLLPESESLSATQNREPTRQHGNGLHRRHRNSHRNRRNHMVRLREVFERLREAGFKMRVAKCDFMKSEIKYSGRIVTVEGVKPGPRQSRNYATGKFSATRPKCKVSWVLLTITVSSFLGTPHWLPPYLPLPALTPRSRENLSNSWLATKSKKHSSTRLPLHSLTLRANSCWTLMPAL